MDYIILLCACSHNYLVANVITELSEYLVSVMHVYSVFHINSALMVSVLSLLEVSVMYNAMAIVICGLHTEACDHNIQWNLSIADTLGTAESVLISEVSTFQG